jgi:hypothetical protein
MKSTLLILVVLFSRALLSTQDLNQVKNRQRLNNIEVKQRTMKQLFAIVMILALSFNAMSQYPSNDSLHTKGYYLLKSKRQEITGGILLGAGFTMLVLIKRSILL